MRNAARNADYVVNRVLSISGAKIEHSRAALYRIGFIPNL